VWHGHVLALVAVTVFGVARAAGAQGGAPAPQPTESPSGPVAMSIEQALRAAAPPAALGADTWRRIRALYERGGFAPLWLAGNVVGPRAATLVAALDRADEHGLRRSDYPLAELADAIAPVARGPRGGRPVPTADQQAQADILLTTAFVTYATDMLSGRVDPSSVESAWHIALPPADVDSALQRALAAPRLDEALARFPPQLEGYETLVGALARYRTVAARGGWPQLPAGRRLAPGDSGPQVGVLRARLRAEGYLPPAAAAAAAAVATGTALREAYYGPDVAAAVARFQTRHGLAVDSAVGPGTRAALNVPADRRALQIEATLERYRWLPHEAPPTRLVVVNIPSFRLIAFDSGRRVMTMPVVVGSELASRRTPVFADSMSYVEFGPYWNVPPSIARNEILPKAARDRSYLTRNGYQLVRGWGDDAPPVDARSLSTARLYSSSYRVRQLPGPKNALGRIKFMFPNEYNVYLHDTPAQALFGEAVRAASHGCVRLSDPAALARFVLAGHPAWPPQRIQQTLDAYTHTRVDLPEKIPVYLLYLTAFEQGGEVAFREDLYDMDGPLLRALGAPDAPSTDSLVAHLGTLVRGAPVVDASRQ